MRRLFLHELPANDDDGTDDYFPSVRSFQRECVRGKSSCDWQTNIHTKGDRKSCTRVEASPLDAVIRALETKELHTRTHFYRQYKRHWRHIRTYTRARANTHTHTHTHACAYMKRERTSEWRTSECCTNDNRHATHVHTRKAFFETHLILTKRIVLNHLESRTKLVDGPQSVRGCKYGLTSIE